MLFELEDLYLSWSSYPLSICFPFLSLYLLPSGAHLSCREEESLKEMNSPWEMYLLPKVHIFIVIVQLRCSINIRGVSHNLLLFFAFPMPCFHFAFFDSFRFEAQGLSFNLNDILIFVGKEAKN